MITATVQGERRETSSGGCGADRWRCGWIMVVPGLSFGPEAERASAATPKAIAGLTELAERRYGIHPLNPP
jgi:hypothetical protein